MNSKRSLQSFFLQHKAVWFWLMALLVVCGQAILFTCVCDLYNGSLKITLISNLLGCAAILAPYFFIKPSWRRTVWIPLVALSVFMFTQAIYYREFQIFYGLNDVNLGALSTGMVIKSSLALIQALDYVVLLMPLVLLPPYLLWRKDIIGERFPLWTRLGAAASMVLLPLLLFFWSIYRIYSWKHTLNPELEVTTGNTKILADVLFSYEPDIVLSTDGIAMMLLKIAATHDVSVKLTDEQTRRLERKLIYDTDDEAAITANRNKNLIFIVVESLNAPVLDFADARRVVPTLVALAEDSASIVARNVVSQAGIGRSAAGQFIYNTGLYPADDLLIINYFADGNYPSIAKALGPDYHSFEVIAEPACVWYHDVTSLSYGFNRLYSLEMAFSGEIDEDAAVFDYAEQVIDTVAEPFFAFITSVSSHDPYDSPVVTARIDPDIEQANGLTETETNYLAALKHFDDSLAGFINHLREKGILDNCVIVISGDHIVDRTSLTSQWFESDCVPLIIYGAGTALNYDGVVGQVDVFPTILDAMGVSEYRLPQNCAPYRGLGRSILSAYPPKAARLPGGAVMPADAPADSLNEIQRAGELLIRSGYFAD